MGELATGDHAVKAKDVHIGENKDKMCFVLHASKTHWKNQDPQIVKIAHLKGKKEQGKYCPFKILRDYIEVRLSYVSDDEPFFIFNDRKPVLTSYFRKTLDLMIRNCWLDSNLYSMHSLWGWRSVDLMVARVSIDLIRWLGRWESNAVYTYLKS